VIDERRFFAVVLLAAFSTTTRVAAAQQAVTRAEVIQAAVARGPRLAIARADSTAAQAGLALARQFANPVAGVSHSKSAPTEHYSLDVPLDFPWLRSSRIGAAQAFSGAATLRFAFEREAVAYEADTAYTRALASASRSRVSARPARDADSLLTLAKLRRDAGDGSELDVQLAAVNAGQQANAAAMDALDAVGALLSVQAVMGRPADAPTIALTETLSVAVPLLAGTGGTPLLISAAEEESRAADLSLTLEKRRLLAAPSLSLGFESHDPSLDHSSVLPTIGISLPLPLFNQNGAAVMAAEAQRDRARAMLAAARIDIMLALARARRSQAVATERAARSQRLVDGANRVAELSLLAYREGAAALPSVLEAQRTAREALQNYVEDVAAARNAAGLVRLLTITSNSAPK
jgi:cobalt-zinc-cadmium efflux system outer membrane protein